MSELKQPAISVVIPCRNEAPNLAFLIGEVDAALAGHDYEVLVVDDGSTDATDKVLAERIGKGDGRVRHIRHDRSAGQSAAVRSGARAARGSIVATMDGDGQNDPAKHAHAGRGLAGGRPRFRRGAGQRLKRSDRRSSNWRRVSPMAARAILNDDTRDTGCGLKAIHTDILRKLPFFDGTHRYVPALVIHEGSASCMRRRRPLPPAWQVELRHLRPRPAGRARSRRRLVAAPPPQTCPR